MSDSSIAEPAGRKWAANGSLYYRLTYCLPMVFVIGAPSLFITRAIYAVHQPQEFVNDSPSISGTAASAPSSEFFEWAMLAVTGCIFVSWTLSAAMNHRRISTNAPDVWVAAGPALLNALAWLAGMTAGTYLATLAVYNMGTYHDTHIMASWVFYISQVLAYLFDIACAVWLIRISETSDAVQRWGLVYRISIGLPVLLLSLFFLYLYVARDWSDPVNRYTMQLIYVTVEYTICLLCFAYPMAGLMDVRQHYRELMLSADGE